MNDHPTIHAPAPSGGQRSYLPGMGRHWLLPLYDPFARVMGVRAAHRRLAAEAELEGA